MDYRHLWTAILLLVVLAGCESCGFSSQPPPLPLYFEGFQFIPKGADSAKFGIHAQKPQSAQLLISDSGYFIYDKRITFSIIQANNEILVANGIAQNYLKSHNLKLQKKAKHNFYAWIYLQNKYSKQNPQAYIVSCTGESANFQNCSKLLTGIQIIPSPQQKRR